MGIYTKLLRESKTDLIYHLKELEDEYRKSKGYKSSDLRELKKEIEETKKQINGDKKKDN